MTLEPRTYCRSNPVSGLSLRKREFFKREPETIAELRMPQIGAWRLEANSQKPANGGLFCADPGPFL
jgi:hypothetical protein